MVITVRSILRWTSCPDALLRTGESLGTFPSLMQREGGKCCPSFQYYLSSQSGRHKIGVVVIFK